MSHHTPDSFVVDLPAHTHQRFGYPTITVASKRLTNFLDGGTQLLIVFLVS